MHRFLELDPLKFSLREATKRSNSSESLSSSGQSINIEFSLLFAEVLKSASDVANLNNM